MLAISMMLLASLATDGPGLATLMKADHWKRAQTLAQARLNRDPNDAEALWAMARVKAVFHDVDGALPLAERAVKLDPAKAAYHRDLSDLLGQEAEKASVFRQFGLARRLKKELDTAVALDPKDTDAWAGLMGYFWQAPAIVGGSKDRARQIAQEVGKIDAARGLLAQAQIAIWEKNWSAVDALFHKAVDANPRSYQAQVALASWCVNNRPARYEEGETHARAAVAAAPDRAVAYSLLAGAYAGQQRLKELDAVLAEAERNVPDNLAPYYAAGEALLAKNADYPRAERCLRKYLSQPPEGHAPSEAFARWRLGQVLAREGHVQEARAELEQAVRLEPKRAQIKRELNKLGN